MVVLAEKMNLLYTCRLMGGGRIVSPLCFRGLFGISIVDMLSLKPMRTNRHANEQLGIKFLLTGYRIV